MHSVLIIFPETCFALLLCGFKHALRCRSLLQLMVRILSSRKSVCECINDWDEDVPGYECAIHAFKYEKLSVTSFLYFLGPVKRLVSNRPSLKLTTVLRKLKSGAGSRLHILIMLDGAYRTALGQFVILDPMPLLRYFQLTGYFVTVVMLLTAPFATDNSYRNAS